MRRQIAVIAAADTAAPEDKLKDRLDKIEDDFAYLVSGISHLGSVGDFQSANELVDALEDTIQGLIEETASAISE